jgi:AcrR family transcriptional regulator
VGNRESLLAGAKQCLYEKGFTRTTARDIATAAGTSLAAIGYHFGTTQALLTEAIYAAVAEWGTALGEALSRGAAPAASPGARFEAIWTEVIRTFAEHRPLWAVQFELIGQPDVPPELREFLVQAQRQGRDQLATLFDSFASPESARLVGSFHQALLGGVMTQWLIDPDQAPSARELTEAVRLATDGWAS